MYVGLLTVCVIQLGGWATQGECLGLEPVKLRWHF